MINSFWLDCFISFSGVANSPSFLQEKFFFLARIRKMPKYLLSHCKPTQGRCRQGLYSTSVLLNESWTWFKLTLVRILKCDWVGATGFCFSWSDLNISASYFQQTLWLVSLARDKYKTRGCKCPWNGIWHHRWRWGAWFGFSPGGCVWTTWKHHGAAFFFFHEDKSNWKGAKSRRISFCKHVLGLQEDCSVEGQVSPASAQMQEGNILW